MAQQELYDQALALLMELDYLELSAQAKDRIEARKIAYANHDAETAANLTREITLLKSVSKAARVTQSQVTEVL